MKLLFAIFSSGKLNVTYEDGDNTPCVQKGPEVVALAETVLATLPEGARGFQLRQGEVKIEVLLADGNISFITEPSKEQAEAVLALIRAL
jgi:hypothetical protein